MSCPNQAVGADQTSFADRTPAQVDNPGTSTNTPKGYDYHFVADVTDFKCELCKLVARQPVDVRCGTYCKDCLQQGLATNSTCPQQCSKQHDTAALSMSNWLSGRIDRLEVMCHNVECTAQMQLSQVRVHEQTCPFEVVACPNFPCKVRVQRQHLQRHKDEPCAMTNVKCKVCLTQMCYKDLAKHQSNIYKCATYEPWSNKCLVAENDLALVPMLHLANLAQTLPPDAVMPVAVFARDCHARSCVCSEVVCDLCGDKYQRRTTTEHMKKHALQHANAACIEMHVMRKTLKDRKLSVRALEKQLAGLQQHFTILNQLGYSHPVADRQLRATRADFREFTHRAQQVERQLTSLDRNQRSLRKRKQRG